GNEVDRPPATICRVATPLASSVMIDEVAAASAIGDQPSVRFVPSNEALVTDGACRIAPTGLLAGPVAGPPAIATDTEAVCPAVGVKAVCQVVPLTVSTTGSAPEALKVT